MSLIEAANKKEQAKFKEVIVIGEFTILQNLSGKYNLYILPNIFYGSFSSLDNAINLAHERARNK